MTIKTLKKKVFTFKSSVTPKGLRCLKSDISRDKQQIRNVNKL